MPDVDPERWNAVQELLNNSPYYCHMGMNVVDAREGYARFEMECGDNLRNLSGVIHGGAMASLVDSACAIAVATTLGEGESVVTVDMRVNYVSSLTGGSLVAEGHVLHRGRYTGVARAEVRSGEGTLIAAGMATIFITRPGAQARISD